MHSSNATKPLSKLETFEDYSKFYRKELYSIAYRLTGNREKALDLLQDTNVKAFIGFHKLGQPECFFVWVRKIMSNIFIDNMRKFPTRREPISLEQLIIDGKVIDLPSGEGDQNQLISQIGFWDDLNIAINTLSPKHYDVFWQIIILESSYEETANTLKIPTGTVRSRLNHARTTVRNAMKLT